MAIWSAKGWLRTQMVNGYLPAIMLRINTLAAQISGSTSGFVPTLETVVKNLGALTVLPPVKNANGTIASRSWQDSEGNVTTLTYSYDAQKRRTTAVLSGHLAQQVLRKTRVYTYAADGSLTITYTT
jgi:hypothetical protein